MEECEFCGEEFEAKEDLKVHWLEDHEDEINSHQKDEAKEAKRKQEERNEQVKARRKKYLYQGVGVAVVLLMGVLLGPQVIDAVMPNNADSLDLEGEPVLGSENASVTVVEFGDYRCPFCREFHEQTFPQLESNYIETGQVNFAFVNYAFLDDSPQLPGRTSERAASAAECTLEQDEEQFWNMHDGIYENQGAESRDWATTEELMNIAREYTEGLDYEQLESCINNFDTIDEVREDTRMGQQNGVTGTPTVFVNGQQVDSSYQAISNAIDQELEN